MAEIGQNANTRLRFCCRKSSTSLGRIRGNRENQGFYGQTRHLLVSAHRTSQSGPEGPDFLGLLPPMRHERAAARPMPPLPEAHRPWELIANHHVSYRAIEILERAQRFAVMASSYLEPWSHLLTAVQHAHSRGIPIHFLTRTADDTIRNHQERLLSLQRLRDCGAEVHEIPWMHAKVYCNESQVMHTSFNLCRSGQDSLNSGVILHGTAAVEECLRMLHSYGPAHFAQAIAQWRSPSTPNTKVQSNAGYCIRCHQAKQSFEPHRPYCHACWIARKSEPKSRIERICHRCGALACTSLRAPLCSRCGDGLRAN
jgi:hypothetical protein